MRVFAKSVAVTSVLVAGWLSLPAAHGQIAVKNQGYVPFSEEPINYRSGNLTDPVALLQKRIDRGKVKLDYEPKHGYLKSVLEKLAIPVDSQTLVFSKSSFQYKKISPEQPRALYFNDDVYIGQVHDGKVIEVVSFDPAQGAIFYILDEHQSDHPVFQRAELDCTQCHVAAGTAGTRRFAAFPLHHAHGDAGHAVAVVHHGTGEPFERAVGRLVCDRDVRFADSHGQRGGRRQGAPGTD